MRSLWVLVVALVLVGGQVRAQESAGTTPLTEASDPAIASVPEASGLQRPRPSLRSRLASWRPISRWLSRTSAREDQEPVAIPVAGGPAAAAGRREHRRGRPSCPGRHSDGGRGRARHDRSRCWRPCGGDRRRRRRGEPRIGTDQRQPGRREYHHGNRLARAGPRHRQGLRNPARGPLARRRQRRPLRRPESGTVGPQ